MHKFISLLIIFTVIETVNGEDHNFLVPEYVEMMTISIIIFLNVIVRQLVIKYNNPIPYGVFTIIGGFIWGILAMHLEIIAKASSILEIDPSQVMHIYPTILIFKTAFTLDWTSFLKALPQSLIISIPMLLFTSCTFGILIMMSTIDKWGFNDGFIFGISCCAIYPATILYLLKMESPRTKQIAILLESEAMFSIVISLIFQKLFISDFLHLTIHWYQYIALILRFIIGGLLTGYAFGLVGRLLFRKMHSNEVTILSLSIGVPFFTHMVSEMFISCCGSISVIVVGLMLSIERATLPKELSYFLVNMWVSITFLVDSVICTLTVALGVEKYFTNITFNRNSVAILTYLMYYAVRFVGFLLFLPFLKRLGYGMDMKNLIICLWCGIKSPFSLLLLRNFILQIHPSWRGDFYFYIIILYLFSFLINGTFAKVILNFLGLREISVARQMNMNLCLKHIFDRRDRTIAVLKMDRFLVDTNWNVVANATSMRHPYRLELRSQGEDISMFAYRTTYCPDCEKELPQEPTPSELKEMIKEAKMRVLKTKKMFYARQFENGMVCSEGLRILGQAVDTGIESENINIELEGLQNRFHYENWVSRFIRRRVQELKKSKTADFKMPRKYLRRVCYKIVFNKYWEIAILCAVFVHVALIAADTYMLFVDYEISSSRVRNSLLSGVQIVFCCIYLVDIVMKILAYSWISIFPDGLRIYFKSIHHIIDTIVFIICLVYVVLSCNYAVEHSNEDLFILKIVNSLLFLRVLRLLYLIEYFYPKFIRYLDRNFDLNMTLTFEIGRTYSTGVTELLQTLPYMIDNRKIRDNLEKQLQYEQKIILELLKPIQREKAFVAVTVKTKQSIRTILKSMQDSINQLKILGWVDDYELDKLQEPMNKLYNNVNSIKIVQPSSSKIIFREISWMGNDDTVIDFLFDNVSVKKFEPGDIVYDEGKIADGIYIVVTGLFTITYTPQFHVLERLYGFGMLPIVDYLNSIKFEHPSSEYIVTGNCIGELSFLTQRTYNCVITSDAHSQVYVLNSQILKKAMEMSPHPTTGLECRIWKSVGKRIALQILLSTPAYQNFSQDQIRYTLARAFIPNLSKYKILSVTEIIEDIVLIEGVVSDFNTREAFIAPCYIPRTVQRLILPKSSLLHVNAIDMEPKLLIIPENDIDEYGIISNSEDTCELVTEAAALKCLQHSVQHNLKKRKLLKRDQYKGGSASDVEKKDSDDYKRRSSHDIHRSQTTFSTVVITDI